LASQIDRAFLDHRDRHPPAQNISRIVL
jgi:hypothetical protein